MSEYKRQGGFGGRGSKGNFNRRGRPNFGGKPFGGRSGFRNQGGRGGRPEMFEAICASCGKTCEVPFRPTGEKPVYCRDCFQNNKGSQSDNYNQRDNRQMDSRESRDSRGQSDELKKQLEQLNSKLDRVISLLTAKPTEPLKDIVEEVLSAPIKSAPVKKEKKTVKKKQAAKKKA